MSETEMFLSLIIVSLVPAAYLAGLAIGRRRGKVEGEVFGRQIGANQKNEEWVSRARAAAAAGVPWYGVVLPEVTSEPEEQ